MPPEYPSRSFASSRSALVVTGLNVSLLNLSFFTPAGGFFCPALDVHRDAGGHLRITGDTLGFDRFVSTCFH